METVRLPWQDIGTTVSIPENVIFQEKTAAVMPFFRKHYALHLNTPIETKVAQRTVGVNQLNIKLI